MGREMKTAQAALEQLQKAGVSDASVSAYTSRKSEFTIDGGRFSLLRTTLDHSLSLLAIKDQCRGTFSGNSFDQAAIEQAVNDCLASAQAGQPDPAWELAKEGQGEFVSGVVEPDMDKLFERTQELLDSIHKEYPKVLIEQMISDHTTRTGVYVNNHGVNYRNISGAYGIYVMFSGHEGEKASSFNYSSITTENLDKPFLDQGSLRQNISDAEKQIHTQQTEGKFEGTVIFTPDCLVGMLGELLGNFASDGVLLDGTSLWKDALGSQVADPRISISMLPEDPRVVGGERYTGEGFRSANYDLIKDGVLEQFMLSAYGANKTGKKRAPNTSFSLVMKPGDLSLDEMIQGIKKGLLVSRYSGGAAGTGGEFSGVAKNSFLIEDGKIGPAVSETMISGNLAGMLKSIAGISKETVEDGSFSLPYLAVRGITISGK